MFFALGGPASLPPPCPPPPSPLDLIPGGVQSLGVRVIDGWRPGCVFDVDDDDGCCQQLVLSRTRRWLRTYGQEWTKLAQLGNWANTWVAARIYCNGIPSSARRRATTHARNAPVTCWGCGSTAVLRWRWLSSGTSPAGTQDSVGWCHECTGSHRQAILCIAGVGSRMDIGTPPHHDNALLVWTVCRESLWPMQLGRHRQSHAGAP